MDSGQLPDSFEVLADLVAAGPARRSVRGIAAVAQLMGEEPKPSIIVNGVQDAVPATDELANALEVLADLIPAGPAGRSVRGIAAVAQLIVEEQKPSIIVNGVQDAVSATDEPADAF